MLNYIRDLQNDHKAVPQSYWKNTSGNTIIRSFIDYAGSSITKVIMIIVKIFIMPFLREFLRGPGIWWNRIESMGKDEAMLLSTEFLFLRKDAS